MRNEALQVYRVHGDVMSSPAERRYVNAKLSYEELLAGLRRWPGDVVLKRRVRAALYNLNQARVAFHVDRNGRR